MPSRRNFLNEEANNAKCSYRKWREYRCCPEDGTGPSYRQVDSWRIDRNEAGFWLGPIVEDIASDVVIS